MTLWQIERAFAGITLVAVPSRLLVRALPVIGAVLLAGCATQRQLMPTPNVYASGQETPFAATLDESLRTARVEIFYATDRVAEPRADGRLDYGIGRDYALAVGEALVDIGGDASWEDLARDARSGVRSVTLPLDIHSVTELARTPPYPLPYTMRDGLPVIDPSVLKKMEQVAATVEEGLREELAKSPRKEILLYVHGVANTFDEALYTTAELWHYMGREFVPIAYTWPAGKGGALRGYTYDRESSEFTVFHFKRFLDWLSRLPDVEGIHVIAHSRGTDVVSTGIRELLTEARARKEHMRKRFKLRNVVLAAPDINLSVMLMRTSTEFFGAGMEQLTVYTSPNDKAIGIAEFLFGGGLRLGQIDYRKSEVDLRDIPNLNARMDNSGIVSHQALIEYSGEHGGAHGHDYFRSNPAVSSDLVLAVRYGRQPGAENGRPLKHDRSFFWRIDDSYLAGD